MIEIVHERGDCNLCHSNKDGANSHTERKKHLNDRLHTRIITQNEISTRNHLSIIWTTSLLAPIIPGTKHNVQSCGNGSLYIRPVFSFFTFFFNGLTCIFLLFFEIDVLLGVRLIQLFRFRLEKFKCRLMLKSWRLSHFHNNTLRR